MDWFKSFRPYWIKKSSMLTVCLQVWLKYKTTTKINCSKSLNVWAKNNRASLKLKTSSISCSLSSKPKTKKSSPCRLSIKNSKKKCSTYKTRTKNCKLTRNPSAKAKSLKSKNFKFKLLIVSFTQNKNNKKSPIYKNKSKRWM